MHGRNPSFSREENGGRQKDSGEDFLSFRRLKKKREEGMKNPLNEGGKGKNWFSLSCLLHFSQGERKSNVLILSSHHYLHHPVRERGRKIKGKECLEKRRGAKEEVSLLSFSFLSRAAIGKKEEEGA